MDILSARIVIDTNVVFEGLTKQGSAAGLIVTAWLDRRLNVYVSTALAYEYESTLSNKLAPARWQQAKPMLSRLLNHAHVVPIYYRWRPLSQDPGDEHVIECTLNASATLITANLKDFKRAQREVGLAVMSPTMYINAMVGK